MITKSDRVTSGVRRVFVSKNVEFMFLRDGGERGAVGWQELGEKSIIMVMITDNYLGEMIC